MYIVCWTEMPISSLRTKMGTQVSSFGHELNRFCINIFQFLKEIKLIFSVFEENKIDFFSFWRKWNWNIIQIKQKSFHYNFTTVCLLQLYTACVCHDWTWPLGLSWPTNSCMLAYQPLFLIRLVTKTICIELLQKFIAS